MASERVQRQIDRLLDEAEQASESEDWETVRNRAGRVLAFDPENADAQVFLAAADRSLGPGGPPITVPDPGPDGSVVPASRPAQPTSFANGRYALKRFLGEDGKKKVYLAHNTLLDREVSLALIKTEGLDEVSRTRIQREAQAMGRLGSHRHIVAVFDLGQEQDQHYMVMGLIEGGDVEGLIEKAEDHRIPLGRAIDVAKEVCRGCHAG